MHVPFVDLKRQYEGLGDRVIADIAGVLSGMQLFLGVNVQEFEAEFARYCGTEFAIGVGSGTEALHLALLGCGITRDDEVITVSNTFIATVEAIALVGAKPVFVDIDPQTYSMDVAQIEGKITVNTRAILPVHLYGHPADMDPILELARTHNLKVIEDACQAHGAEYLNRRAGCLGDAGCFSFYFTKNLGAYGEAGMITTSDPDIASRCRMLRDHGQDAKHHHALLGINSRLDEIQAAILRAKLPHLDEWNDRRRNHARAYDAGLPPSVTKPSEMPWARHVYHLYVIRTPHRDELRAWLAEKGVATGIHYPIPIHMQDGYQGSSRSDDSFLPTTEKVASEILSLPMYPELTASEVAHVCECIRSFYESTPDEADDSQIEEGI